MSRKLQSEIERVLKKIGEGVQEFNNILEKVRNANTNNQKEKYESDLKKEIKKLQRQRDQLKNWITDKDVKDKKPLLDARKVIEEHMETFRDCERKTKTKAYSKEGLLMSDEDDEKEEVRAWVADTVSALSDQISHLEGELENPDIDMEKLVTYEHLLERNAFHVSSLDIVLKSWENGEIGDEAIAQIREALDEYIEDNQDPNYYENEELYDDVGVELPRHLYENPGQSVGGSGKRSKDKDKDAEKEKELEKEKETAASAAAAAAAAAAAKEEATRIAAAEKEKKERDQKKKEEAEAKAKAAREAAQAKKDRKASAMPPGVATSNQSLRSSSNAVPTTTTNQPAPTWAARAAAGSTSSEDTEQATLQILEKSMQKMPKALESDRPKEYTPKNPYPMPSYYPAAPLPFDSPAVFEKFDTDTLFFIFYYQQGTYQQYLAAAELKSRSWRYHKKYLTWFQRHEEPKEITQEYEQGTYVYFDYETGWCQRKKTEFTFAYRYLEDN